MKGPFVICDHGLLPASLVPPKLLGPPGFCPAGAFDTVLWHGRLVGSPEHLARFESACVYIGIKPWNLTAGTLEELITASNLTGVRSRIRVMAFKLPQQLKQGSVKYLAAAWPAPLQTPEVEFTCAISSFTRAAEDLSYQHKLLGRQEVAEDLTNAPAVGAQDFIYLNDRGEVCEAAYSNLWVVKDNKLYTPPLNSPCLPGIVREEMLVHAEKLGIPAKELTLSRQDLGHADEIFLTSSVRGIQPVTQILDTWKEKKSTEGASITARLATILNF